MIGNLGNQQLSVLDVALAHASTPFRTSDRRVHGRRRIVGKAKSIQYELDFRNNDRLDFDRIGLIEFCRNHISEI